MNEKLETLKELLIEILKKELGWAGTPLVFAKAKLIELADGKGLDYNEEDISKAISELLNSWEADKTIAELSDELANELDLPPYQPMWHLKILTPEQREEFLKLSKLEQAIIQLLRNQNNPQHLGAIAREDGRKILLEQGFSVEKASFGIPNLVRTFLSYDTDEPEWWFGLIWAHESTDEYKKIQAEQMKEYEEKEARRLQMIEESERKDKKNP